MYIIKIKAMSIFIFIEFSHIYEKIHIHLPLLIYNQTYKSTETFSFINTSLSYSSNDYTNLLLSISNNQIKHFLLSKDYEFTTVLLNDYNNSLKITYSGHPNEEEYKTYSDLFKNLPFQKSVFRTTQLNTKGIQLLYDTLGFKYFTLPNEKLKNIGKIQRLHDTSKKYFYLKNKTFHGYDNDNNTDDSSCEELYPYLLVNIVEGSSIYKITSKNEYERLGGSSFGANTFFSLSRLICNYDNPLEAIDEAFDGDNSKIDLIVEDIFGGSYENFNLDKDLIASSFGKIRRLKEVERLEKKDISKSLLLLFCICNAQIISLFSQNENIKKVIISNCLPSLEVSQIIQSVVSFMTKGECKVLFSDYSIWFSCIGSSYI